LALAFCVLNVMGETSLVNCIPLTFMVTM